MPRLPDYHATFSIVAMDSSMGEFGVAVQSRAFCCGARVPHAKGGVGAIATQAMSNLSYGPQGLSLLEQGVSAPEVVKRMTQEDELREHRQLAIIDAQGRIAQHTGKECLTWAGHRSGKTWAAQGNILAGKDVVEAMGRAFEKTEGLLAERLMAAMEAAQAAGGDRRGQQAGAVLVVRPNAYFDGIYDRLVDIRVDDHPEPIHELRRLLNLALPSVYLLTTRHHLENREPGRVKQLLDRAFGTLPPDHPMLQFALIGYDAHTEQKSQALSRVQKLLASAGSDRASFVRYLKTNALFTPLQGDSEFEKLFTLT